MWQSLLVIALIICGVHSATVQFNTSVDCSIVPCDLGLSSIWINNNAPTAKDTVQLIAPADGKLYSFTSTNSVIFQNLYTQNIILSVSSPMSVQGLQFTNSNVTFANNSRLDAVTFSLFNSHLSILYGGIIHNQLYANSAYYSDASSSVEVYGMFYITAIQSIDVYGSIMAYEGSTFNIYGVNGTYSPSYSFINTFSQLNFVVTIPDNSNYVFPQGLSVQGLYIGNNANVTIMTRASTYKADRVVNINEGGSLNLVNIQYSVPGDIIQLATGAGKINIYSSYLYLFGTGTLASALTFSGNNTATFYKSILQDISFSEGASVLFIVMEVTFINTQPTPFYIPGSIAMYIGFLTLVGSFSFSGGFNVGAANVYSNGHITFGDSVVLKGGLNTVWNISGSLTAPSVIISSCSILSVSENLQINGDLTLDHGGVILLNTSAFVFVTGAYTQGPEAGIILMGLETNSNSPFNSPARIVANSATIGGNVKYTFNNTLTKNTKYPIIQSLDNTITSTFKYNESTALSGDIKSLSFDYSTAGIVYAVYKYEGPKKLGPLVWYWWVVIGGGAVILAIIVGIVVMKERATKGYQTVAYSGRIFFGL